MIDEVLADAGAGLGMLDAIAFGRGPGSFTGLRIACSVAQGLGFGAGCPLVAVSTLQVIAAGMHRSQGVLRVLVAVDARMGEVYWGGFEWDGVTMAPAFEESVVSPHAVHVPGAGTWAGAGSGWSVYRTVFDERVADRLGSAAQPVDAARLPDASDMLAPARLAFESGLAVAPEDASPVYLRSDVARAAPRRLA